LLQPGYFKPVNDRLRFMAAEEGIRNYGLLTNDGNIMEAMNGASRGRTYFVDLQDTGTTIILSPSKKMAVAAWQLLSMQIAAH
jgi:hypothetical protein